ncbi:hypothetical protein JCM16303_003164 [Sporobolomyces ruberrimus]
MFCPALDVVCCICSAKGIVIICSAFLAATYLAVCYVLREIAFPVLKKIHENWLSYMVIKYSHIPVMDWIEDIKIMFQGALIYASIGLGGLLGALFEVQLLLWPYCVYLCVSASGKKVYEVALSFIEFQDKIKEACNKAGDVLGFNCDEEFATVKTYTYVGGAIVALLMCTTLFCTLWLIRTIHKQTGSYLFTFCGAACGGDQKGSDDESNSLEKGWLRERMRRGRVRRGGRGFEAGQGIELKSMGMVGLSESSSSDGEGRTFVLPRAKR